MHNIWIQRNQQKIHTLEIAKNAVFRYGPIEVNVIKKQPGKIKIRFEDLNDIVDIIDISDEIRHSSSKKASQYYGKLKLFKTSNSEPIPMVMNIITNIEITAGSSDFYVTIEYR